MEVFENSSPKLFESLEHEKLVIIAKNIPIVIKVVFIVNLFLNKKGVYSFAAYPILGYRQVTYHIISNK